MNGAATFTAASFFMKVTESDIQTVASLSRLKIRPDESARVISQLNEILTYVDNLNKIDTENIQPTTYALPMQNVFRADIVKPSLNRELALSNAPLQEDGYFKVPRVLEE